MLSRFSKNGKRYDVPTEHNRQLPKFKDKRKLIVGIFYGFLIILFILLLASFIKATKANDKSHDATQKVAQIQKNYEDNAESVQYSPKLKLYADDFIDLYMNIPKDTKEFETRTNELVKFFPSDYKNSDEKPDEAQRQLNSKEFYNITRKNKQTIIQYIVNYDVTFVETKEVKVKKKKENEKDKDAYETKTEEKEHKVNQNLLLNIPIQSDKDKFVIIEQPFFTPIPNIHLNKSKMVDDNLRDNKREDNPKIKAFINDFFEKYASSKSEDMAYLMDNPVGLEGTREVGSIKDLRLYPNGNDYTAKVEVLMKDKGSPIENLE
ncbi:conjugal transfer protein, partial [Staphylococcus succinus]|uniref:conjugal transfer protein n=1 Tax=Staphylococcus succinus TaxID=61015 RepID=UPI0009E3ED43